MDLTEPPDEATWRRIAELSPAATPFHTPLWGRVAEAADFEAWPLGLRAPDGTVVIYPLARRRRRVAASYTDARSSWAGTYGGPIAERELSAEEQNAAHRAMLQAVRGNVEVLLAPGAADPQSDLSCELVADSTHQIPIDTDFDGILRRMRDGHRAAYKRGLREGVDVRRAAGPDAVARYLEMYQSSLRRWGDSATRTYPPEVFERLDAVSREAPDVVRLTFAERDGSPMAAGWTLHWRGHGIVWAVVSHDPPKGISPINVLYGELLREAVEEEARVLDMNPSGGLKSVQDTKRWYGAVELPVWRLRKTSPLADHLTRAINLGARLRRRSPS